MLQIICRRDSQCPQLSNAAAGLSTTSCKADLDHADVARARLTFDEAFLLQLMLVMRRNELKKLHSIPRKTIKEVT